MPIGVCWSVLGSLLFLLIHINDLMRCAEGLKYSLMTTPTADVIAFNLHLIN